jgi:hypothetical protein
MRRAWAVRTGLVVAVLLGIGAGSYEWWHQLPDRVDACGRTYGHTPGAVGGGPFTLAEVRDSRPRLQIVGKYRRYELWGERFPEPRKGRPACGLGIYLRDGDDAFLGYGLLGGP